MKKYSMFLGKKNQYCENDYTTKHNLQFQCDPYQITYCIFFTELKPEISQFICNSQRPWIAKAVLRKKTGAGGISFPDFRWYFRASSQDSMLLVQKLKYRSMEQDRKPRNKPMNLWVPYFWQRRQVYTMGQRQPLQ